MVKKSLRLCVFVVQKQNEDEDDNVLTNNGGGGFGLYYSGNGYLNPTNMVRVSNRARTAETAENPLAISRP